MLTKEFYYYKRHHDRHREYVEKNGLPCQDCHGLGGEYEIISNELGGPWVSCGWCEGTGKVTKRTRGLWLRMKKGEKK
jgi:hypothetical protein